MLYLQDVMAAGDKEIYHWGECQGYWDVCLCRTNGECISKAITNTVVAVKWFFQASVDGSCDVTTWGSTRGKVMWLGRNSETGVYCKTIGIRPSWGKTWWSQPTRDELPCSLIIPAEDRRSAWATCRHGQMVSVKHKRTRDKPSRSLFSCPVSRPLFFFSYCKKLLHIPRPCMFPLHFHLISFGVQINGCVSETADSW